MKRLVIKLSSEAKVLPVFSANKGDNMGIGKIECLGERQ